MANVSRGVGVAHDGELFIAIDKILNGASDNIVMFHIGYGEVGANHLCDLTGKTASGVNDDLRRDFSFFGIDFPIT